MKLDAINKITKLENETVLKEVLVFMEAAADKDAGNNNQAKNYDAI